MRAGALFPMNPPDGAGSHGTSSTRDLNIPVNISITKNNKSAVATGILPDLSTYILHATITPIPLSVSTFQHHRFSVIAAHKIDGLNPYYSP